MEDKEEVAVGENSMDNSIKKKEMKHKEETKKKKNMDIKGEKKLDKTKKRGEKVKKTDDEKYDKANKEENTNVKGERKNSNVDIREVPETIKEFKVEKEKTSSEKDVDQGGDNARGSSVSIEDSFIHVEESSRPCIGCCGIFPKVSSIDKEKKLESNILQKEKVDDKEKGECERGGTENFSEEEENKKSDEKNEQKIEKENFKYLKSITFCTMYSKKMTANWSDRKFVPLYMLLPPSPFITKNKDIEVVTVGLEEGQVSELPPMLEFECEQNNGNEDYLTRQNSRPASKKLETNPQQIILH